MGFRVQGFGVEGSRVACGGECRIEKKSVQIEGFLVKERVFKFRGVGFRFFRVLLGFRVCLGFVRV